jgi:Na+/H+-dicarboxylate symporter
MNLIPIGVLFLVLSKIVAIDDFGQLGSRVGLFALTTIFGLLVHGLVVLPAIYYTFTRRNPYTFLGRMSMALLTAFGTASSFATLPVTISCLENNNGINRNVVRFCAPIGSVINMDGTGLYEAVAAIFIAQSRGLDMDLLKVMLVFIAAIIASMSASGVPHV